MSTLFEYYNTGDDSQVLVHGATWYAQTFTPSIAHKITSVELLMGRKDSPGTITVSIRATDGSGHPTGEDLCSGTTNGNTLPSGPPGEWREITLGDGYDLSASTKYAIVVRALDGDANNAVYWMVDITSPTYSGGNQEYSNNSGSSWTSHTDKDLMFEEWGSAAETYEKTVSMSALLKAIDTETINLDTLLKDIDTETISLDALIRALGLSKTVALDAILGAGGTVTVDLDTLLEGKADISVNLDLFIKALEKQDISLDALIVARNLESINVDILLKAIVTTSVSLDAIIGEIFTFIPSISLDIILFKALPPNRIYTIEVRNGDGDLVAILENVHEIDYTQEINAPHSLTFTAPATESKLSNILLANEYWLRDNRTGTVIRKFKMHRKADTR